MTFNVRVQAWAASVNSSQEKPTTDALQQVPNTI